MSRCCHLKSGWLRIFPMCAGMDRGKRCGIIIAIQKMNLRPGAKTQRDVKNSEVYGYLQSLPWIRTRELHRRTGDAGVATPDRKKQGSVFRITGNVRWKEKLLPRRLMIFLRRKRGCNDFAPGTYWYFKAWQGKGDQGYWGDRIEAMISHSGCTGLFSLHRYWKTVYTAWLRRLAKTQREKRFCKHIGALILRFLRMRQEVYFLGSKGINGNSASIRGEGIVAINIMSLLFVRKFEGRGETLYWMVKLNSCNGNFNRYD